jgi:predicted enzyme related to lactoylglutathione lyase
MADVGLIGAVLYAKDVDRLVKFYAAITGLAPQATQNGFAALRSKSSHLIIVRIPRPIADTIDVATPPEIREDTPLKLKFSVDDIAEARDRAAELGGAVYGVELEWEFEGAKLCDGYDPEGNVFQLSQRP